MPGNSRRYAARRAESPTPKGGAVSEGPSRRAVSRAFTAVADRYAEADFLHTEIRERLLERLDLVTLDPAALVDLGAGPPAATAALAARYPAKPLLAIDLAPAMLGREAQPWTRLAADAARLPLADASVDLIAAGMLLHWCEDPAAVLREARRVLRYPGLLLISTLGPDTLRELRSAWASADREHSHTLTFADMHNLGDALIHAGFVEPVVDTHRLTVAYQDPARLFADLRQVGAADLSPARRRSLTGRARWSAMRAALQQRRDAQGRLPVTFEVVYAHAWTAGQRTDADSGEVAIPLNRLQRRRA